MRATFIPMVQSLWHTHHVCVYTWRISPCSPCWLPFVSPSTYLAPSRCVRNCPPPSQVACKLTPFVPLHPVDPPPLQPPRTPTAPRLTTTTSGIYWLLISSTICFAREKKIISRTFKISGTLIVIFMLMQGGIPAQTNNYTREIWCNLEAELSLDTAEIS